MQSYDLVVTMPGLEEDTQNLKIRLLAGPPHSIHVAPEDTQEIENGNPVQFDVELWDAAGNVTTENKKHAICTVSRYFFLFAVLFY